MKKIDGRSKAARALKDKAKQQPEAVLAAPAENTAGDGIIQGYLNKYKLIDVDAPQKTVLQEAHELIYGAKEADYGDPKENLTNIAQQWNVYLIQKYGASGVIVDAVDVCWMMTLLKMCREFSGSKRDSLVDAAGYIGLIERVRGE